MQNKISSPLRLEWLSIILLKNICEGKGHF